MGVQNRYAMRPKVRTYGEYVISDHGEGRRRVTLPKGINLEEFEAGEKVRIDVIDGDEGEDPVIQIVPIKDEQSESSGY